MIEGLKVTVPGKTVQELLEQKATYHDGRMKYYREREAFYTDQKEKLAAAGITPPPEDVKYASSSNNNNPINDAQESAKRHANDAREARFVAKYVDPAESFLLSKADLHTLGVLRSGF